MIRRFLALLTVVTAPAVLAGQRVEVTLNDAVQRALQVQPAVAQARGGQRNASAEKRSVLGGRCASMTRL